MHRYIENETKEGGGGNSELAYGSADYDRRVIAIAGQTMHVCSDETRSHTVTATVTVTHIQHTQAQSSHSYRHRRRRGQKHRTAWVDARLQRDAIHRLQALSLRHRVRHNICAQPSIPPNIYIFFAIHTRSCIEKHKAGGSTGIEAVHGLAVAGGAELYEDVRDHRPVAEPVVARIVARAVLVGRNGRRRGRCGDINII